MRARTVLLSILFLLLPTAGSALDEHEYVGVKKCRSCHKKETIGNQYGLWLDGRHAMAFETLKSDDAVKIAAEKGLSGPPHESAECLGCHVTAWGVPEFLLSKKFDQTLGVQCEACHGAGKDYSKKKIMIDIELAQSNGLVIPTEELCVECHNDDSPVWDPERYTRPDGTKVGFDFEQASELIAHPVPEYFNPETDLEGEEEDHQRLARHVDRQVERVQHEPLRLPALSRAVERRWGWLGVYLQWAPNREP